MVTGSRAWHWWYLWLLQRSDIPYDILFHPSQPSTGADLMWSTSDMSQFLWLMSASPQVWRADVQDQEKPFYRHSISFPLVQPKAKMWTLHTRYCVSTEQIFINVDVLIHAPEGINPFGFNGLHPRCHPQEKLPSSPSLLHRARLLSWNILLPIVNGCNIQYSWPLAF